jgi:hypothetical protein
VAIRAIAASVGAKDVKVAGTPMSVFKKHYTAVLKRAKAGSIEIVYQGAEPFVILGVIQLHALVASLEREHVLADVDVP